MSEKFKIEGELKAEYFAREDIIVIHSKGLDEYATTIESLEHLLNSCKKDKAKYLRQTKQQPNWLATHWCGLLFFSLAIWKLWDLTGWLATKVTR